MPIKSNPLRHGRLLWLLVALAFGVSLINFAIGGQHAKIIHEHHQTQQQPPIEQTHGKTSIARSEHRPTTSENARHHLRDSNADNGRVYAGKLVTEILQGKKQFPKRKNLLRMRYRPGTLGMSHAEALQHCFVNTTHYGNHIANRAQSLMSVSDRHKLIYRNNPKASSSSARHAMIDFLEGGDVRMKHDNMEDKVHERGYSMISFIRAPLSRFYSSYDEAFFRMGPWMANGPIVRDKPRVRQAYLDNKYRVEPYPYLYEGMETIDDFRLMYCPKKVLRKGHFLDCNEIPSIDDGNLARRFEQFVRDYSGLDPFDIHLNLQISNLVFPTGEPFPITTLYNATQAEKGWQEVATQRGVDIPDGEMTHGRKITRRFNVSMVSLETKRKVCRILALDYCCLNIELPRECRGDDGGEDDAVFCAVEERNDETMKYALRPLVIRAWKDP